MRRAQGLAASGLAVLSGTVALVCACGGPNVGVPLYPQPAFAPAQRVDYAPPPAQIETLPETPPAPGCRWVDGQWVWSSQRWDGRPGGWIQPPERCRYSLPSQSWALVQGAAALYYRPGRWYSVSEPQICPDPPPCAGTAPRPRREPR